MKNFVQKNNNGFTLIEVILAVSISAVIVIGLMTSFWRGIAVWKKTNGITNLTGDFRFFTDILETDLKNAVKIPLLTSQRSFSINEDGKSIVFFMLKRLRENKSPHIYKVQYKLENYSEDFEDIFILKRADRIINNINEVGYKFKDSEFKNLVSPLKGKKLKFSGSIFKDNLKLSEAIKEDIGNIEEKLEIIKLIRRDGNEIVLPLESVYVDSQL